MVSNSSILAIIVTLIITLIAPIIIPIVYSIKNKGKGVWKAWAYGALGFFVLQVLIRLPILNILATQGWFIDFAGKHYVWYCVALAFTAALFEVVARFVVAMLLRKNINFHQGFAAGLGHGGIEAIILIGMTYVNNLTYSVMINTGAFEMIIEQMEASATTAALTEQLYMVKDALIGTPSYAFYLSGYERILSVIFHISMSLLVCYMVYKRKAMLGVVIAFLTHFIIDFVAPLINGLATPNMGNVITTETAYLIIYSLLTVFALIGIAVILKIRKAWINENSAEIEECI